MIDTTFKILSPQDIEDFSALIDVFENVFGMQRFVKPDKEYLQQVLSKPHFLALVAKADNKVVGGLTVYILDQYYSQKPLAYLYDLAVLAEFQRKGIGAALIRYLNGYCKEKGFEEVFVQADREDGYALDFYRSTKPTGEEDVAHFYYFL